jgi:hypothetical protein
MQLTATLSLLLSLLSVAAASAGGDYETAKAEAEALKLADSYATHPAVEAREAEVDSSLPAALGLEERTPKELQGRACRDNGCTCKKVKQGQVRLPTPTYIPT